MNNNNLLMWIKMRMKDIKLIKIKKTHSLIFKIIQMIKKKNKSKKFKA
jgi:hypothetical protein